MSNTHSVLSYLSWVEVRPRQHVFKVNVSVGVLQLHHNHWVCLPQQGPSGSEFTQLHQLQHDLYGKPIISHQLHKQNFHNNNYCKQHNLQLTDCVSHHDIIQEIPVQRQKMAQCKV